MPAGRQTAGRHRALDHGERHAILHAAGGVVAFELDQHPRAFLGNHAAQLHDGRAANDVSWIHDVVFERGVGRFFELSSPSAGA
jgi:hypothetical protein